MGGWPEHLIDKIYGTEGGRDILGQRPQDGQKVCRDEFLGMMIRKEQASVWDDVPDTYLEPQLVKKARQVELQYFRKLKVYTHVPRSHQRATGGKIMGFVG